MGSISGTITCGNPSIDLTYVVVGLFSIDNPFLVEIPITGDEMWMFADGDSVDVHGAYSFSDVDNGDYLVLALNLGSTIEAISTWYGDVTNVFSADTLTVNGDETNVDIILQTANGSEASGDIDLLASATSNVVYVCQQANIGEISAPIVTGVFIDEPTGSWTLFNYLDSTLEYTFMGAASDDEDEVFQWWENEDYYEFANAVTGDFTGIDFEIQVPPITENLGFEDKLGYCTVDPSHGGVTEGGAGYVCEVCGAPLKYTTKNHVLFQRTGNMAIGFMHPTKGYRAILDEGE